MKIIRIWGLIVFFVLLLLLTLAWYLLAPLIIANSIEDIGSEALGAKVEVASVDLTLFPVSVAINHLAAADPDKPMQNLFESRQVKFSVDTAALLWKKVVIDELVLSGVKTATKRQTSGALKGGRKSAQVIQSIADIKIPDVNDIDVNELVGKADLITLKRVDSLKQNQNKMRQEWQQALDKEAFDARVADIKTEFKRLSDRAKKSKLNLLKDRKDWKKLKKAINAERQQIASLSTKLKQDKQALSDQLKSVKNGPNDDVNAVMEQFGLGAGMEGLVDKYLGPQYTPWVKRALAMAKGFKPGDSQQAEDKATIQVGDKVYFTDKQVFPEVLVKKVLLSGSDQGWELDGKGFDLGYLPWLTGKPAKLNIQLGGKGAADLDISSNWPSATDMITKLKSKVSSWPIEAMQFMQTPEGNWMLNSGDLSANIDGELTLEKVNLTASFSIASPKLSVPDNISGWQKSLASAVNQEAKIDFDLTATGSIMEPKIRLNSSVEKLFQSAIGEKVKQQAQKLTGKVKQQITDKVGDISALENFNGNFDQWQSQLGDKDKLLENLMGKIKL